MRDGAIVKYSRWPTVCRLAPVTTTSKAKRPNPDPTRDGKIRSRKDYLSMLIFVERILCKDDGDSLEEKGYCEVEVRGVDLEFDNEKLATILGVHGKNGICEYIEEVWEESKYTKPLQITRRFANDATIMKAGRVRSIEMKPSRRFIHFTVMKNVIPRFGKRDTSKLLGLDIYGSLNGKEVSRSATSNDETHELCDLDERSRVATMEIGSLWF
ncbi:hypothetical protein Dimus_021392 [Dionaea muscipula]